MLNQSEILKADREGRSNSATQVQEFITEAGASIYQIPLEEFPGFWGYAYLVICEDDKLGEMRVLIDTGSGFGESNLNLERGILAVEKMRGEVFSLQDFTHILITHGHIDHFGGLAYIHSLTRAKIGVHELDRRILTNYEERLSIVARRLEEFLSEAGVEPSRREELVQMYLITKSLFHSVSVDFTYEASGMRLGPFEMLHVPGHCAGHVVIRLHDVLFTGDHVLETTSPHQSPEHLTLSTGLEHYMNSLDRLESWAVGVRLGLGGHKEPIHNLSNRLNEIRELHRDRLKMVLELLEVPQTIDDVSRSLFGQVHGYKVLLALEETGAHVEYLYQRGLLGIHNLSELEDSDGAEPIRYFRLPDV